MLGNFCISLVIVDGPSTAVSSVNMSVGEVIVDSLPQKFLVEEKKVKNE